MGITLNRASAATVSFTTPQEVVITHLDDSIKIGNGTYFMEVNSDGSTSTSSAAYSTRIDEVSSAVTYFGKAGLGAAEGSAIWQISKLTISGTVSTLVYADGNKNFDNVWSNRASLTYT